MDIVGVILAGGLGQRLHPLTRVANKHLLPVYNRPMIHYPLMKMASLSIEDVIIVTSDTSIDKFRSLLGNGADFGFKCLQYATQIGEDGIAAALALTRDFAGDRRVCVILGDNLFEDNLRDELDTYLKQPSGARILLKEVSDPERFGVPRMENGRIVSIEEKPKKPASRFAVTGVYFYDSRVFDVISKLVPSARGEYEITDVSNDYISRNELTYGYIKGWWSDCGTFESLYKASTLVREMILNGREYSD